MSFGILLYAIVGMFYAKLENDTFDIEFGEAPRYQVVLGMTQLSLHFLRIVLVWPIYLCEDLILSVDDIIAKREGEEEDE
tara:strand:- start:101 stop:340 length:240 start_codon:yes stop_codon:yes gene_type:complete